MHTSRVPGKKPARSGCLTTKAARGTHLQGKKIKRSAHNQKLEVIEKQHTQHIFKDSICLLDAPRRASTRRLFPDTAGPPAKREHAPLSEDKRHKRLAAETAALRKETTFETTSVSASRRDGQRLANCDESPQQGSRMPAYYDWLLPTVCGTVQNAKYSPHCAEAYNI